MKRTLLFRKHGGKKYKKRCKEIDTNPSLLIDGEQFMAELKQRYV